jgi:hypothetical protein
MHFLTIYNPFLIGINTSEEGAIVGTQYATGGVKLVVSYVIRNVAPIIMVAF